MAQSAKKGKARTEVPTLEEVQAEFESQGGPEAWTNYDELMNYTRLQNQGGTNAAKVIAVEALGDHGKKEGEDGYEAAEDDHTGKKGYYYPMGFKNEKPCYVYNGNEIYWDGKSWKGPGVTAGSMYTNRSDGEYPKDARWPEGKVTKVKTMRIKHSTWAEAIWQALPGFATEKIQELKDRLAREKAEEEARIAREKAEEEARLAAEAAAREAAERAEAERKAEYERVTAAIAQAKELGLEVDTGAVMFEGPEQNAQLQAALSKAAEAYWTTLFKQSLTSRVESKGECYIQSKAGDWHIGTVKSKVSVSRTKCTYGVVIERDGKTSKVTVDNPKRILSKDNFHTYQTLFNCPPPGISG